MAMKSRAIFSDVIGIGPLAIKDTVERIPIRYLMRVEL